MATRGGAAPLRMFESHSFVVATPPMEHMVKALTTTALVGTLSESRDVSPDAAARALERELGIPWAKVVVTKHAPEDFLIRFDVPNHRRIALEAGSLPCRGVTLSLKPWSPTARGIQRTWRFYCRLAIEGLPQQSWTVDAAQQVVTGKVIIDRLGQQSVERVNTSACFAWGWAWNPDVIPTSNTFSIIERIDLSGRVVCAEGVPPVPERGGATYPVLIHLDTSKESAGPNGVVPPPVRYSWALGVEDTRSSQPPRPRGGAHERLQPRRRDDDADDAGAGRRPRGRRSFKGTFLGCNAPEGSVQAPAPRARGQRGGAGRRRDEAAVDSPPVCGSGSASLAPATCPADEHVLSTELVVPPPPAEPWLFLGEPVPPSHASSGNPVTDLAACQFDFDADRCWSDLTRVDPMLLEDAASRMPAVAAPAVDWPLLHSGSDCELLELALPPPVMLGEPVATDGWSWPVPIARSSCMVSPPPLHGLLQLTLGHVGVGRADDVAFFEAVGAFGPAAPLPATVMGYPMPLVDDVASQLESLELGGGSHFLDGLFSRPEPAVLGTPPLVAVAAAPAVQPAMPATPARRSARIESLGLGSLTAAERAQALLAKQLEFIDRVQDHSPKVRGRFVDRFRSPLGRKAVTRLARIVGIGSHASIALPDEDLQACLGAEEVGA